MNDVYSFYRTLMCNPKRIRVSAEHSSWFELSKDVTAVSQACECVLSVSEAPSSSADTVLSSELKWVGR